MFRFNNPEALLTLLITVAAYTALRAIDDGRARWVVATGIAIGFGFLTKQLQVLLVVPGFALAYLTFGSPLLRRRIRDLALAALSMVLAAGWWIAIVELWPKSSRPYIGGSQNNSIIELTLGYNGLGRLTGQETGSVGAGGPGGGDLWGETGITRLFNNEMGGQIAWLLPTAIACLIIGLWLTRHAPRHSLQRSSLVVWGGCLVVTALLFGCMSVIFHAYYNVVLAPAIGALVGIGTTLLWARREHWAAATALAGLSVATAWWATQLLERAPSWHPWLAHAVLVAGIAAGIGFMISALPRRVIPARLLTSVAVLAGISGATAALAAPTGWTLETVSTGHQGSLVTAGPAVANGGPVGGFGGRGNGPGGGFPAVPNNGALPAGRFPGGPGNGGPVGGFPGLPGNGTPPTGRFPGGTGGTGPPAGGFPGRTGIGGAPGGGLGGLLNGVTVTDTVASLLIDDASSFTWVAAVTGSQNASSYQLATEEPVMPIGGFNGSDSSPTLADFQSYVAGRRIHYYIASGLSDVRSMNGSDTARQIEEWVSANYKPTTVDGTTLYDLTT
jgi:4-amino-4-deoxy-L-arabinose transferase-like glycosyltransferase